MYKLSIKHKNVLRTAVVAFLCLISLNLSNITNAFQIKGNGSNLKITQSNKAQSTNFYVDAKLKPTRVAYNIVEITDEAVIGKTIVPSVIPGVVSTNAGEIEILVSQKDNSSPYLGTANWSYVNRSAEATAKKRLAKEKLLIVDKSEESTHSAAPKKDSLKNNLQAQIVKSEDNDLKISKNIEPLNKEVQEKEFSAALALEKKSLIASNDSQVIANPAKFSLKFLNKDIVYELPENKNSTCNIRYSNYGENPHWNIIAHTLFFITIGLTLIIFCLAILVYIMWQNSLKKK